MGEDVKGGVSDLGARVGMRRLLGGEVWIEGLLGLGCWGGGGWGGLRGCMF